MTTVQDQEGAYGVWRLQERNQIMHESGQNYLEKTWSILKQGYFRHQRGRRKLEIRHSRAMCDKVTATGVIKRVQVESAFVLDLPQALKDQAVSDRTRGGSRTA